MSFASIVRPDQGDQSPISQLSAESSFGPNPDGKLLVPSIRGSRRRLFDVLSSSPRVVGKVLDKLIADPAQESSPQTEMQKLEVQETVARMPKGLLDLSVSRRQLAEVATIAGTAATVGAVLALAAPRTAEARTRTNSLDMEGWPQDTNGGCGRATAAMLIRAQRLFVTPTDEKLKRSIPDWSGIRQVAAGITQFATAEAMWPMKPLEGVLGRSNSQNWIRDFMSMIDRGIPFGILVDGHALGWSWDRGHFIAPYMYSVSDVSNDNRSSASFDGIFKGWDPWPPGKGTEHIWTVRQLGGILEVLPPLFFPGGKRDFDYTHQYVMARQIGS